MHNDMTPLDQAPPTFDHLPAPIPGKLYLHLSHGRYDPTEEMGDWGFAGPWIGPLDGVFDTYKSHLRMEFASPDARDAFRPYLDEHGEWLVFHEDLVKFGDTYYGDWGVVLYEA